MSKLILDVFKDEKAPALALLSCVIRKYGVESFDWEPGILRAEIEDDFDITLSDLQSDKIQAAITVLTTNSFQDQWEAFEKICHLFNNVADDFSMVNPLEAEEIAQALADYYLINVVENAVENPTNEPELDQIPDERGENISPTTYSPEVRAYVGQILFDYGCCAAPKLFPTAILPGGVVPGDNTEKEQALEEIFNARLEFIMAYLEEMKE